MFNESIFILKNVDFKEIWNNEKTTNEHKENIWKYIQTLFIIGKTVISDSDKIKDIVSQFKNIQDNETDGSHTDNLALMLKNLTENNESESNENLLTGGLIGSPQKNYLKKSV